MALMVSLLLGCTVAKPPDNREAASKQSQKAENRKDECITLNHFFDEPAVTVRVPRPYFQTSRTCIVVACIP